MLAKKWKTFGLEKEGKSAKSYKAIHAYCSTDNLFYDA